MPTTEYRKFVRTAETPGHRSIFVLCDKEGPYYDPLIKGVQCSTEDRIPFVMKLKDVRERYSAPTE